MGSAKLLVGTIIGAAVGDVALRLWRDGRLLLLFLFTVLTFWMLFLLQYQTQMNPFGAVIGRPTADAMLGLVLRMFLWQLVASAVGSVVLTPLALAVHRKVLLNESPSGALLVSLARPRGRNFFMAAFSITLPYLAGTIIAWSIGLALPRFGLIAQLIGFVVAIAGLIFGIRLAPALPAIAVDRPGSWLATGFALSRGSAWQILGILALTSLVIWIAAGAIVLLVAPIASSAPENFVPVAAGARPESILMQMIASPVVLVIVLIASVAFALNIATWASALSHLYRAVAGDQAAPAAA